MKTDLFQSCGHCWVFQICWYIECNTFTASSYRIWNSSTGIPSTPLALFVVMLHKAHLTSHSRMSGSRWMITPLWLFESWWSFFIQFFCVFLPPLLNIFCFCQVHTISVLYCAHLCMKCPLGVSNFLKRSLVFPILLFSSISFHCSLRKAFLYHFALLWSSTLRWIYLSFSPFPFATLLFSLFVRPPQTVILPFCISFPWGWFWSPPPVQCLFRHSVRSNPLNLFVTFTV